MTTTTPVPNDPWAHRSGGMRCKTCMWFVPKQAADGITDLGRCRRHAPTGMGFPPVFVNDWCGDHRLDENRVALISRPPSPQPTEQPA